MVVLILECWYSGYLIQCDITMVMLFLPEVKGWCEQFPPGVPFCSSAGQQPGAKPGNQELVVLTLNTPQLHLPVIEIEIFTLVICLLLERTFSNPSGLVMTAFTRGPR